MNTQLVISLCFLVASLIVLALTFFVPAAKNAIARNYIKMCTGFYISGTLLIVLIRILKPELPEIWTWLSEILTLIVYAASCGMVVYITRKFDTDNEKSSE